MRLGLVMDRFVPETWVSGFGFQESSNKKGNRTFAFKLIQKP